jgi:hypothetical protein
MSALGQKQTGAAQKPMSAKWSSALSTSPRWQLHFVGNINKYVPE